MAEYNWVDFLILGIFLSSILYGLVRGLIKELLSIVAWVAAFIVASVFTTPVAHAVVGGDINTLSPWAFALAFVILFVATLIFVALIARLLSGAVDSIGLGFINRFLGALFGFVRGFLMNIVIIFILQLTLADENHALQQSKLAKDFTPIISKLDRMVLPYYNNIKSKLLSTISELTVR